MGVVDVMVGSGIEVVVAVSVLPANCGVDVESTCLPGCGGDTAGAPHANINTTNVNNRGMFRFIFPLLQIKQKGGPREATRPACYHYTTVLGLLLIRYSEFQCL